MKALAKAHEGMRCGNDGIDGEGGRDVSAYHKPGFALEQLDS